VAFPENFERRAVQRPEIAGTCRGISSARTVWARDHDPHGTLRVRSRFEGRVFFGRGLVSYVNKGVDILHINLKKLLNF